MLSRVEMRNMIPEKMEASDPSDASKSLGLDWLKRHLKAIYVSELVRKGVDVSPLNREIEVDREHSGRILSCLEEMGFIQGEKPSRGPGPRTYTLSPEGRRMLRIVLTGGVFDIIHIGHLTTLREAKEFGDILVVVVARDEVVEKVKGKKPINREGNRVKLVGSLKPVDLAVLGDPRDIFRIVEVIEPDIIALGYDQKHDEEELSREIERRCMKVSVVRLKKVVPEVKTSEVLAKIEHLNTL